MVRLAIARDDWRLAQADIFERDARRLEADAFEREARDIALRPPPAPAATPPVLTEALPQALPTPARAEPAPEAISRPSYEPEMLDLSRPAPVAPSAPLPTARAATPSLGGRAPVAAPVSSPAPPPSRPAGVSSGGSAQLPSGHLVG